MRTDSSALPPISKAAPPAASSSAAPWAFEGHCRAIHNPGRYAEYTDLCGCDDPVVEFLAQMPEVDEFWGHVKCLVEAQVGVYLTRGFTSLNVWFGCTGGQHRSVYFANRLAEHLRAHFPSVNVVVTHREEARWPANRAAVEVEETAAAGAS